MKKAAESAPGADPRLVRDAREKAKAMIGVGGGSRPFLDYCLMNIEKAGYREVVIVVGGTDASIRDHYEARAGADRFPGLSIGYVVQNIPAGRAKPLGTADALLTALRARPRWSGGTFTVCNSDNIYSVRALSALRTDGHENAMIDYDRDALGFPPERVSQFAVIRRDDRGFLADLVEKPAPAEIAALSGDGGRVGVSMNIFRLSYDVVLPYLESVPLHPSRDEKELPVAVRMLAVDRPRSVFTIPLSEQVPDLTRISDVSDVAAYLESVSGGP